MSVQEKSFIPLSIDMEVLKNALYNKFSSSSDLIWIKQLSFSVDENKSCSNLFIYAPNTFCKDYVLNNYKDLIVSIVQDMYQFITNVEFFVGLPSSKITSFNAVNSNNSNKDFALEENSQSNNHINSNNINNKGLINTYSFNNFSVNNLNELVTVACKQISNTDIATFNQIYIYGKSGTGKTHLLHAIGNQIVASKPDAKVLYITAEKFMYSFIKHSKEKTLIEFKDELRSLYCLIIDDIHFLSGKTATENELFHTISELKSMNSKVILSGNASPFLINGLSNSLANEIASNLTIEIPQADIELRRKIIKTKLNLNDIKLTDDVIEFLSLKQLNAKQIDGAIKRIFMYLSLTNIDLNISKINNLLNDLFYNVDAQTTSNISDIKKCVCDFFDISVSKIDSYVKEKGISFPRQIAMFLSKKLTNKTFSEIGKMFGGKDHATVLYAVKKIENLMNSSIDLSKQIETLENMCRISS